MINKLAVLEKEILTNKVKQAIIDSLIKDEINNLIKRQQEVFY
jgi:hypothetical protein